MPKTYDIAVDIWTTLNMRFREIEEAKEPVFHLIPHHAKAELVTLERLLRFMEEHYVSLHP